QILLSAKFSQCLQGTDQHGRGDGISDTEITLVKGNADVSIPGTNQTLLGAAWNMDITPNFILIQQMLNFSCLFRHRSNFKSMIQRHMLINALTQRTLVLINNRNR